MLNDVCVLCTHTCIYVQINVYSLRVFYACAVSARRLDDGSGRLFSPVGACVCVLMLACTPGSCHML